MTASNWKIPFGYLVGCRYTTPAKIFKYTGFNWGLLFLGLWLTLPEKNLFVLLGVSIVQWLAFLNLYEVSYYINDKVSANREARPTQPESLSKSGPHWFWFVVPRACGFVLLTLFLSWSYQVPFVKMAVLPLVVFAVTFIHNFTFSEWRIIPFSLLYLLKYNICFYLLPDGEAFWRFNLVLAPGVSFLIVYYFVLKRYTRQYHTILARPWFLLALSILAGYGLISGWVQPLGWYSLLFVGLIHVGGGVIHALHSLATALFFPKFIPHFHTFHSFDSKMDFQSIFDHMGKFKTQKVYVTDHNEEATQDEFQNNKVAFQNQKPREGAPTFYYGIEQDINGGNHFLLCNLQAYEPITEFAELKKYRELTDCIVWAHPSTAYLFKWKSLKNTLQIASNVDYIEVVNLRPTRKYYSHILTFCLAMAFSMVFNKKLTVGFDAHSPWDLQKIKSSLFLQSLKNYWLKDNPIRDVPLPQST